MFEVSSSALLPKFMVPRHSGETLTPLLPSWRYSMLRASRLAGWFGSAGDLFAPLDASSFRSKGLGQDGVRETANTRLTTQRRRGMWHLAVSRVSSGRLNDGTTATKAHNQASRGHIR